MNEKAASRRGMILFYALWALTFLAVLAAQLSVSVRQRITLTDRLTRRLELRTLAQAGIRKAVSFLKTYQKDPKFFQIGHGKQLRQNNPQQFAEIRLGQGRASVYYWDEDNDREPVKRYGMMDEAGKLNFNKATDRQIERLLIAGLKMSEDTARDLALAIVDWRSFGSHELFGFYSQEYYSELQFPYQPPKSDFQTWDELLLVKGMNQDILNAMRRFFTIYGEGKVNINTASWQVLWSLDLGDELISKILGIRRGPDGIEATADDYVFTKSYDVGLELSQLVDMKANETEQIDAWNLSGGLTTESYTFSIVSEAMSADRGEKKVIVCVLNVKDDKIEYWREE